MYIPSVYACMYVRVCMYLEFQQSKHTVATPVLHTNVNTYVSKYFDNGRQMRHTIVQKRHKEETQKMETRGS